MRKKSVKKELMVKRKVRLKKRRKKFILTLLTLLSLAIVSTAIFYKFYNYSNEKNLSYFINYNINK
ncbi:MAG: hypothetical protein ACRC68_00170 [Clostridium sp.]